MLEIGINSFVTLEEAEDIVENEVFSASSEYKLWEGLSDKDKEIICKRGTLIINRLEFIGNSIKYRYKLKFPRVINGVVEVPHDIKVATVLSGLMERLDMDSEEYKLINAGIERMTVGPNSVTFKADKSGKNKIHNEIMVYVDKYLIGSVRP